MEAAAEMTDPMAEAAGFRKIPVDFRLNFADTSWVALGGCRAAENGTIARFPVRLLAVCKYAAYQLAFLPPFASG